MVLFCNETKLPRTVYALFAVTVDIKTSNRLIEGNLSCVYGSRSLCRITHWGKTGV
jgi:hypothetical protein